MTIEKNIKQLAKEFANCKKILNAIGDENRQHLILEMLQLEESSGVRVGTITEKTYVATGKGYYGNAAG